MGATPPLEEKSYTILSFELASIEKWPGFLFFFLFLTVTSIDPTNILCKRHQGEMLLTENAKHSAFESVWTHVSMENSKMANR